MFGILEEPKLLWEITHLSYGFALQRRRDRINEKMRALQELIPNSNKVCSQCYSNCHVFVQGMSAVV